MQILRSPKLPKAPCSIDVIGVAGNSAAALRPALRCVLVLSGACCGGASTALSIVWLCLSTVPIQNHRIAFQTFDSIFDKLFQAWV